MIILPRSLSVCVNEYPLATPFRIARGIRTSAFVVVASITDGNLVGRGECTPYARYGETPEEICRAILQYQEFLSEGGSRCDLQALLPPGAARNALDCALWDLEAKQAALIVPSARIWDLPGIHRPFNVPTIRTISLGTPSEMAEAATRLNANTLKVKLGGRDGNDATRIKAVRDAAPDRTLIVDANEGWTRTDLHALTAVMEREGVAMIEQPLPVGEDTGLAELNTFIPICADESIHTTNDFSRLTSLYQMINIKLDKTGGLTEAFRLRQAALENDLKFMVGCMLGSSLAMAPALLLTSGAAYVDLDGPTWLQKDCPNGIEYNNNILEKFNSSLWG